MPEKNQRSVPGSRRRQVVGAVEAGAFRGHRGVGQGLREGAPDHLPAATARPSQAAN